MGRSGLASLDFLPYVSMAVNSSKSTPGWPEYTEGPCPGLGDGEQEQEANS